MAHSVGFFEFGDEFSGFWWEGYGGVDGGVVDGEGEAPVAAEGPDQAFQGEFAAVFEFMADCEGGLDAAEVGFDRVGCVVVDRAGLEVTFRHSEGLLDMEELSVSADRLLCGEITAGDLVALDARQGCVLGRQGVAHGLAGAFRSA